MDRFDEDAIVGAGPGSPPVGETLTQHVLALPMNPFMSETDTEHVCSALLEAVGCAP